LAELGKLSVVAGAVGAALAVFLSETQTEQAIEWAEIVKYVATAIAGAAAAFIVALRARAKR